LPFCVAENRPAMPFCVNGLPQTSAAMHSQCRSWVKRDRSIQPPGRLLFVVSSIATFQGIGPK
jgi:hypothetical protein